MAPHLEPSLLCFTQGQETPTAAIHPRDWLTTAVSRFKKIWNDSWGPRLEHILRNSLLTLLDQPEATLTDVLCLLDDRAFRRTAATRIANARGRVFWLRECESYPARSEPRP